MSLRDTYQGFQDEIKTEKLKEQNEEARIKEYYGMLRIGNGPYIKYPFFTKTLPSPSSKGIECDSNKREKLSYVYKILFKEAVDLIKPEKWNTINFDFDESLITESSPDWFAKERFYLYTCKIKEFQIIDLNGIVGLAYGERRFETELFKPKRFSNIFKIKKQELTEEVKRYYNDIHRLAAKSQRYVHGKVFMGQTKDGDNDVYIDIVLFDDGNAYSDFYLYFRPDNPTQNCINFYCNPEKFVAAFLNDVNGLT